MTRFETLTHAVAVAGAAAVLVVAAGCVRTSTGNPVAARGASAVADRPGPSTLGDPDSSNYGVVPTSRAQLPAQAVTCEPEHKPQIGFVAQVADAAAPVVTVPVPDGWSMQGGSGDIAGHLTGPQGMNATITIAATSLEPAKAFEEYAARMMAEAAVSSISVLPAELCEYSGQKLLGAWSDTPQNAVEFVDRVVHVWTNAGNYLVSVHTTAPTGTPGFDGAAELLAGDFQIRIP
ncbi:hypothetical protein SBI67_26315 [Mycolicibacterium sp. 120266]|uniref:hypothetical protein n=1 Tax=Mycolicibacterium sp. 120266 TaxID=3090601 RepID=UPI00299ED5F1|nr:hypothetical protein [Mycolicibacterium sp. 120266]MDX1875649.1 hypothetical protein [Mycolicibacterium sp. 120266]